MRKRARRSFPSPQAREAMDRASEVHWTDSAVGFEVSCLSVPHPTPREGVRYVTALLLDHGIENGVSHGCALFQWIGNGDEAWRKFFRD